MDRPIPPSKTCEWIGEGEGCSHAPIAGRNYCSDHLWKIYQKGTGLRKRKKDTRTADAVRRLESLMNEAIAELTDEGVL